MLERRHASKWWQKVLLCFFSFFFGALLKNHRLMTSRSSLSLPEPNTARSRCWLGASRALSCAVSSQLDPGLSGVFFIRRNERDLQKINKNERVLFWGTLQNGASVFCLQIYVFWEVPVKLPKRSTLREKNIYQMVPVLNEPEDRELMPVESVHVQQS